MVKREARRNIAQAMPAASASWKSKRSAAEKDRAELTAKAKAAFANDLAARAELTRTAELLKSERESQGLSLADLQDRTGMSRAAICRLENLVDSNPTIATLNRIAEALGKKLVVGLVNR